MAYREYLYFLRGPHSASDKRESQAAGVPPDLYPHIHTLYPVQYQQHYLLPPPEIVSMRAAASILYIPFFITILLFPNCNKSGKNMISIKSQCVRVSTAKMKILITYSLISDDLLRDYHKLLILSNSF